MPLDALPEGFKDQAEGTNTDWNNPIQRLWHKSWFAYGPRSNHWWAKWREWPITVFAIRSKEGSFRVETETYEHDSSREDWQNQVVFALEKNIRAVFWNGKQREIVPAYLSAIQYWTKWHIQIQWPFFVAFHFYIDDVPVYPDHAGKKRVLYFRFGARRDADKVYWFPSIFLGLTWN